MITIFTAKLYRVHRLKFLKCYMTYNVFKVHDFNNGHGMGLLSDTNNCVLRICRECKERFPRHPLTGNR